MNWKEAKIVFIYPSRSRPLKFRQGLDSIINNLSRKDLAHVYVTVDEDDPTLPDYRNEAQNVAGVPITIFPGTSKNKIDAVSRDLHRIKEPYQVRVCMSDDMRFKVKGFDDIIRKDFETFFPDGDGCLHYPDQNQGEGCMTLDVVDKIYQDRFGYIYFRGYESVECDLENQDVAKMLGRYKFIENRIFDHLHPSFGQTSYDAQYNRTEDSAVHDRDKATRRERIKNNYGLIKVGDKWDTPRIQTTLTQHPMEEKVENHLGSIMENAKKTEQLRKKLQKKVDECKELATEICAIGLVKVEVSVIEEAVK